MSGVTVDPLQLAATVGVGIVAHLVFFGGNHLLTSVLRLGGGAKTENGSFHRERLLDSRLLCVAVVALRRAVVLMSSQKSVTIAIAVLTQLSAHLGPEAVGVACVPCVLVHLSQTVIDSFIASRWMKMHEQKAQGGQ